MVPSVTMRVVKDHSNGSLLCSKVCFDKTLEITQITEQLISTPTNNWDVRASISNEQKLWSDLFCSIEQSYFYLKNNYCRDQIINEELVRQDTDTTHVCQREILHCSKLPSKNVADCWHLCADMSLQIRQNICLSRGLWGGVVAHFSLR